MNSIVLFWNFQNLFMIANGFVIPEPYRNAMIMMMMIEKKNKLNLKSETWS